MFDEKVISEYDLSLARNQLAVALAELQQAEAQEADARNNLSYTEIKSPSNGVVGTLPYRIGALVSPNMEQPFTVVVRQCGDVCLLLRVGKHAATPIHSLRLD